MLEMSASEISFREDKSGIDTFLLKQCIEFRQNVKTFNRADFGEIYYMIFESFDNFFEPIDFENTPFAKFGKLHNIFSNQVWSLYFINTIEVLTNEFPEFAICLMKILFDDENKFTYHKKAVQITSEFLENSNQN